MCRLGVVLLTGPPTLSLRDPLSGHRSAESKEGGSHRVMTPIKALGFKLKKKHQQHDKRMAQHKGRHTHTHTQTLHTHTHTHTHTHIYIYIYRYRYIYIYI